MYKKKKTEKSAREREREREKVIVATYVIIFDGEIKSYTQFDFSLAECDRERIVLQTGPERNVGLLILGGKACVGLLSAICAARLAS